MAQNISFNGNSFSTQKSMNPVRADVPNVIWVKTVGGKERAIKWGESVRSRGYRIWLKCTGSPDDETVWNTFIDSLSGYSTTFTFVDHRGESFTARFAALPGKVADEVDDVLIDVAIIEVLT